eukprot:10807847-Prorocentrum_lima.AAC.1
MSTSPPGRRSGPELLDAPPSLAVGVVSAPPFVASSPPVAGSSGATSSVATLFGATGASVGIEKPYSFSNLFRHVASC